MATMPDLQTSNLAVTCPLCASPRHRVMSPDCALDLPTSVHGAIIRCADCSMWFKAVPSQNAIEEAYGEHYSGSEEALAYFGSPAARSFFRKVLAKIEPATNVATPKLLDIGCGPGTLLEEARSLGFDAEGLELCGPLAELARGKGFQVHQANACELQEDAKYDVITAMDIIEHVPDPVGLLKSMYRGLKSGGELVIYTPNHRGAVVVLAKALAKVGFSYPYRNIFGGNHVCFFDDRSLLRALASVGFPVRMLWKFPYDPRRPGQKVSLASLAVVRAAEELGRPFGAMFRMIAFARKP